MEVFGAIPYAGLSVAQVAGVTAVYFLAFFLKGVFGYGAVATLVVGTSLIINPHHAVLLAAMANLLTHVQFIPDSLRAGDRPVAGRLVLWLIPAIAVGVWLFARVEATALTLMIGTLIFLLVLVEIFGLTRHVEPLIRRRQAVAGPIAATISGLMAGVIGAGSVVFLSLYIRILCPSKEQFRGTILLIATVFVVWRNALFLVTGITGMQIILEAVLLAPVAIVAGWAGTRAMRLIPQATFFRLYQLLLLLAALLLVWQGLSDLATGG